MTNISSSFPPQGLCTSSSHYLECSSLDFSMVSAFSFRFLDKRGLKPSPAQSLSLHPIKGLQTTIVAADCLANFPLVPELESQVSVSLAFLPHA